MMFVDKRYVGKSVDGRSFFVLFYFDNIVYIREDDALQPRIVPNVFF